MRYIIENENHELQWAIESEAAWVAQRTHRPERSYIALPYGEYQEMQAQIAALERRVEGMREAVGRWRRKAGVDAPTETWELFRVELTQRRDKWVELRTYILPVEPSPDLVTEAWALVAECPILNCGIENCTRVVYDGRRWTVTFYFEKR